MTSAFLDIRLCESSELVVMASVNKALALAGHGVSPCSREVT